MIQWFSFASNVVGDVGAREESEGEGNRDMNKAVEIAWLVGRLVESKKKRSE